MGRVSDIIVVGAGVVGCTVAYELSRRGASVEVVDERSAGMGATQAAAGILAPYIEAHRGSPLFELTARSLGLFDEFVAQVTSDSGLPVSYKRNGTLQVAADDSALALLKEAAGILAEAGVGHELVDAAGARGQEPHLTNDVTGGLLIRGQGFVSARELIRAVTAAARRHGAQLVEQSRVRRITRAGSDIVVATERGTLSAGAVVLAAGSWSAGIEINAVVPRVPVRPIRGQLLQLAWNGLPLRRVTWASKCYLVPWDDGTLLVGATSEEAGFDEQATVAGVRDLLDAACEVVPHAWTAGFLGARVGLRPRSADDLPVIGRSSVMRNLVYATGHYRNGVLLAPLTARLVADALLDDRVDPMLDAVAPSRFGDL